MKKFILSLGLLFVGIISFCNAYDISFTYNCRDHYSACVYDHNYNYTIYFTNDNKFNYGTNYYLSCDADNMTSFTWNINQQTNSSWNSNGTDNPIYLNHELVCLPSDCSPYISFNFSFSSNLVSSYSFTCHITDTEPGGGDSCDYSDYVSIGEYNSLSGQYNHLLVEYSALLTDYSSCTSQLSGVQSQLNSCQSNTSGFNDQLNNCNLSLNACNSSLTNCLQYNCPEIDYTGDLLRSNIYINNILHPGRQFVNIEIPDYIQWDYSVGDDDFNLYVGSGYDVDYIESVIDINSYRPTSEDFTNVFVSGLTLVMPYIVIALFIIFVRKLLKRIFK